MLEKERETYCWRERLLIEALQLAGTLPIQVLLVGICQLDYSHQA